MLTPREIADDAEMPDPGPGTEVSLRYPHKRDPYACRGINAVAEQISAEKSPKPSTANSTEDQH